MSTHMQVRPSPIAGSWYSADPHELESELLGYIEQATLPAIPGEITGLIAPHAGYFYSGKTAGYAYRAIAGRTFDLVVIVSPLHEFRPYNLLTSAHSAYATPLGEVKIEQDLLSAFRENLLMTQGIDIVPVANDREHSLEIQLPFLQVCLAAPFELLPIMVRTHDLEVLTLVSETLSSVLQKRKCLLVASTDLSHFYPEQKARALDAKMLQHFLDFAPEKVLESEERGTAFACGAGAVALVLMTTANLGANKVTLLHQSTSANSSGDIQSVVGYGAAAISNV